MSNDSNLDSEKSQIKAAISDEQRKSDEKKSLKSDIFHIEEIDAIPAENLLTMRC